MEAGGAGDGTSTLTGGNVGGLVGYLANGCCSISSCGVIMDINSTNGLVGGIIGVIKNIGESTVNLCFSICDIHSDGNNVGGIIGDDRSDTYYKSKVLNCYYSGNICGKDDIGGIVGVYN